MPETSLEPPSSVDLHFNATINCHPSTSDTTILLLETSLKLPLSVNFHTTEHRFLLQTKIALYSIRNLSKSFMKLQYFFEKTARTFVGSVETTIKLQIERNMLGFKCHMLSRSIYVSLVVWFIMKGLGFQTFRFWFLISRFHFFLVSSYLCFTCLTSYCLFRIIF